MGGQCARRAVQLTAPSARDTASREPRPAGRGSARTSPPTGSGSPVSASSGPAGEGHRDDVLHRALGRRRAWLAGAAAIAVLSSAATLTVAPDALSPWNPALGVGAGLVLGGGAALALPVLAGHLLAASWLDGLTPLGPGVWRAVASTLVSLLFGLLAGKVLHPDPRRWSVRHVVLLLAASIGVGLTLAGITLLAGGPLQPASTSTHFRVVVGSALGVLLGLPAVALSVEALGWRRDGARAPLRRRTSAANVAMLLGFLAMGVAAYTVHGPTGERFWSLYFFPILWTAFRFGMRGVVAGLWVASVQALLLARVVGTPLDTFTNFHFFLFNFTATSLLLAAALGARQAAERARGQSEALLAGAFRVTNDALVLFRREGGEMLDVNAAWCALLGRSRDSLIGASFLSLPEWADETGPALRAAVSAGAPIRGLDGAVRTSSGRVRYVIAVVELVTVDAGDFGVAFVRDVTEARMIERQRLQSQKLEAVGMLASGVAHDFNNVLTVVSASGGLLRNALPSGDARRADAESIIDAARRGAQLTQQLLAFSRQQSDDPPRATDAAEVIRGMSAMLARLLGGEVRIETRLGPGRVMVLASPGQLEQVVVNLAVNARDAMAGRGTLAIDASAFSIARREFRPEIGVTLPPGPWVVFRFTDTGEGIDPAILARIFEPFFTTKTEGQGTGLGLSTVYGILRRARGHIGVQSAVGEGTTFILFWPRVPDG